LEEGLDGGVFFIPDEPLRHRWTPEARKAHLELWIKATEQMFASSRKEVLRLRKSYKEMDSLWLLVPSLTEGREGTS